MTREEGGGVARTVIVNYASKGAGMRDTLAAISGWLATLQNTGVRIPPRQREILFSHSLFALRAQQAG